MDNRELFGCSPRWNQSYGRASFFVVFQNYTKSLGWLWKRSKQDFKVIECICSILCSLPHFCAPLAPQLRSQSTCRSGPRTAWRSASRAGPCTSSHWAPAWTQHQLRHPQHSSSEPTQHFCFLSRAPQSHLPEGPLEWPTVQLWNGLMHSTI